MGIAKITQINILFGSGHQSVRLPRITGLLSIKKNNRA